MGFLKKRSRSTVDQRGDPGGENTRFDPLIKFEENPNLFRRLNKKE
jgi:hypothetical protein